MNSQLIAAVMALDGSRVVRTTVHGVAPETPLQSGAALPASSWHEGADEILTG